VVILPRTFVHLDATGAPVEAMTNTGRPPQLSDQLFVEHDETNTPASAAIAHAVVTRGTGGDWSTAGTWHALPT
jgi:hypothetical protein